MITVQITNIQIGQGIREFIYTGYPFDTNASDDKPRWIKYNGSPGAYDPSTFVLVDIAPMLTGNYRGTNNSKRLGKIWPRSI